MDTRETTTTVIVGTITLKADDSYAAKKAATVIQAITDFKLTTKQVSHIRIRPNCQDDLNKLRRTWGDTAYKIAYRLSSLDRLVELWLTDTDHIVLRFAPKIGPTKAIKNIQQAIHNALPEVVTEAGSE